MKFIQLKLIATLMTLVLATLQGQAQYGNYNNHFSVYGGISNLYGDIDDRFLAPHEGFVNPDAEFLTFGARFERSIRGPLFAAIEIYEVNLTANDRKIDWNGDDLPSISDYSRSLNYQTELRGGSFLIGLSTDRFIRDYSPFLSFSIYAGIGHGNFTVYGDLIDENQQFYNYWSDGTIRAVPEDVGNSQTPVVQQDGNYEINVSRLDVEEEYNQSIWYLPVGAELKFKLAEPLRLVLGYSYHFTQSDYLDDLSGDYRQEYDSDLQEYAANPTGTEREIRGEDNGNDHFERLTIGLQFSWYKKRKPQIAPHIYTTSNKGVEEPELTDGTAADQDDMQEKAAPPADQGLSKAERDSLERLEFRYKTLWFKKEIAKLENELNEEQDTIFLKEDTSSFITRRSILLVDSLPEPVFREKFGDSLTMGSLTRSGDLVRFRLFEEDTTFTYELEEEPIDTLLTPFDSRAPIDSSDIDTTETAVGIGTAEQYDLEEPGEEEFEDQFMDGDTILLESPDFSDEPPVEDEEISTETEAVPDTIYESEPESETIPDTLETQDFATEEMDEEQAEEFDTASKTDTIYVTGEESAEAYDREIAELRNRLESLSGEEKVDNSAEVESLRARINSLENRKSSVVQPSNYTTETSTTHKDTRVIPIVAPIGVGGKKRDKDAEEEREALEERIAKLENILVQMQSSGRDTVYLYRPNTTTTPDTVYMAATDSSQTAAVDSMLTQVRDSTMMGELDSAAVSARLDSITLELDSLQRSMIISPPQIEIPDQNTERSVMKSKPKAFSKRKIFFGLSSAELNESAVRTVGLVAEQLRAMEGTVVVTGFSDPSGPVNFNEKLAGKRAESVKKELVSSGIDQSRIEVVNAGVDNDAKDDLSYGRRVEITLESGN